MGYFLATWDSMLATFRQALKKPTTVQYPFETRPRPERIRASFALVHSPDGDEACIGCKKCERICPSDVIRVEAEKRESPVTGKGRNYASDFTLNLQACIICELCVQVCPVDAIIMTQSQETPGFSREDLVLTMDKLYANEHAKRWAWSNGTVLTQMQDPERKPERPAADGPTADAPAAAVPAEAKKEGSE